MARDDFSYLPHDRNENRASAFWSYDLAEDCQLPNDPKFIGLDSIAGSEAGSAEKVESLHDHDDYGEFLASEGHFEFHHDAMMGQSPAAVNPAVNKQTKLKPDRYIKTILRRFRKVQVKEKYKAFYNYQKKYLYGSSTDFFRKAARDFYLATYHISESLYKKHEIILLRLIHHSKSLLKKETTESENIIDAFSQKPNKVNLLTFFKNEALVLLWFSPPYSGTSYRDSPELKEYLASLDPPIVAKIKQFVK